MPKYVVLFNYTEQGIKGVRQGPARRKQLQERQSALGVSGENYLTMGPYDRVGIIDAPSEEAFASFMLSIGERGNVRTLTMRAFTAEEEAAIIEGMPAG